MYRTNSIRKILRIYITHVSFNQAVNSVVNAVHSVATVDAVTHKRTDSCVHATGRSANVHDAKVEATLGVMVKLTLTDSTRGKNQLVPVRNLLLLLLLLKITINIA